ncbi:MAG: hypothetical protein JRF40_13760 [Deltaproteobacteria bacterium]|nr:hypothetical protein [Deltaproteobacteria bacterium]
MIPKKSILVMCCFFAAAALVIGCVEQAPVPSEQNFVLPEVTLDRVEVAHYWGWWYFKNTIKPTMGDAGNYGAPLDLAFVFDIKNTNAYPIRLDELKFTVAFEEFDLNTVDSKDAQWIPPGKTNKIRVHAMFDGRQSLLSLLVTGGFKLKEKTGAAGPGPALKQLGKWWKDVPTASFPIYVKEGASVFSAGDISKVGAFSGVFPK